MTDNPGFILNNSTDEVQALLNRASIAMLNSRAPNYLHGETSSWYRRGYWRFGGLLLQWVTGTNPNVINTVTLKYPYLDTNFAALSTSNYDAGGGVANTRVNIVNTSTLEVVHVYGDYANHTSQKLSILTVGIDPDFTGFD